MREKHLTDKDKMILHTEDLTKHGDIELQPDMFCKGLTLIRYRGGMGW